MFILSQNKYCHTSLSLVQSDVIIFWCQPIVMENFAILCMCIFIKTILYLYWKKALNFLLWFLLQNIDFVIILKDPYHLNTVSDLRHRFPHSTLTDHQLSLLQNFHPAFLPTDSASLTCDFDTIGFFIAKFTKACWHIGWWSRYINQSTMPYF